MNYAVGVGVYIAVYVLATILPLLLLSGESVIRVVIFSIPILLVGPRVSQRFADGTPLLPQASRNAGGFLLGGGFALIWIGHLAFFGAIAAAIWFSVQGAAGVPVGIVAGYAFFPYLLGIVFVEISFRSWSSRQPEQVWKSQRNGVFVVVGLIIMAHLALAIGGAVTGRAPDLLSYYEREALARGRGYAREVQRVVDRFYVAENTMPCRNDNYIDIDSLLGDVNRDSEELSIELLDCGRFVVTIHKPIDGISDGELLFVASPGDADAGRPLVWKCFSVHHERIERHTNGGCTYNPSLANTRIAPVGTQSTAATPEPSSDVYADGGRSIQYYLDRLAEPVLWENCSSKTTSYRLLKFDTGQYVAAVRISHDSQEGVYRTVSSSSPGKTIGMKGYVDKRAWGRLEAGFDTADF